MSHSIGHKLVIAFWGNKGQFLSPLNSTTLFLFHCCLNLIPCQESTQILLMFLGKKKSCLLDSDCIINLKPSVQIADKWQYHRFIQELATLKVLEERIYTFFCISTICTYIKSCCLRIVHDYKLLNSITFRNYYNICGLLFHTCTFAFKRHAFLQLNLDGAYTLIWMKESWIFNCFWHPIWQIWNTRLRPLAWVITL